MAEVKIPDPLADSLRQQFPSNSKVPMEEKPEKEKLSSVATEGVSIVKESVGKKFLKLFVAEDMGNVKKWIVNDVLVPGIKTLTLSAIEMLLFGRVSQGYFGRVDYNKVSTANAKQTRYTYTSANPPSSQNRNGPVYAQPENSGGTLRTILFRTRQDAENVLGAMIERLNAMGEVSVMEYYDLSGTESDFTHDKWGWKDLRSVGIKPIRGGYILTLPSPGYID